MSVRSGTCACCGYDLAGLPDPANAVCPECGSTLELRQRAVRSRKKWPIILAAGIASGCAVVAAIFAYSAFFFSKIVLTASFMLLVAAATAAGFFAALSTVLLSTPTEASPLTKAESNIVVRVLLWIGCFASLFFLICAWCAGLLIATFWMFAELLGVP